MVIVGTSGMLKSGREVAASLLGALAGLRVVRARCLQAAVSTGGQATRRFGNRSGWWAVISLQSRPAFTQRFSSIVPSISHR